MRKRYSATYKAEIVQEIFKEEKTLNELASVTGVHPTQLKECKRIALTGLPELFSRESKNEKTSQAYDTERNALYAEIGRLTTQVNWLKKNLASTLSRAERLALVERESAELPLCLQAELLSLSRSSLYYQAVAPSVAEVALKHRIDEIYTAQPFYGSRRITAQLRREAQVINRKTVQQYMREMGIAGICPGPNLSRRDHAQQI